MYDFLVIKDVLFRTNRTTGEAWRCSNVDTWIKITMDSPVNIMPFLNKYPHVTQYPQYPTSLTDEESFFQMPFDNGVPSTFTNEALS